MTSAEPIGAGSPRVNRETPSLAGDRLVFNVAEAGELLGLSRAFANELVARGELAVVRFGRHIVVPKAAGSMADGSSGRSGAPDRQSSWPGTSSLQSRRRLRALSFAGPIAILEDARPASLIHEVQHPNSIQRR